MTELNIFCLWFIYTYQLLRINFHITIQLNSLVYFLICSIKNIFFIWLVGSVIPNNNIIFNYFPFIFNFFCVPILWLWWYGYFSKNYKKNRIFYLNNNSINVFCTDVYHIHYIWWWSFPAIYNKIRNVVWFCVVLVKLIVFRYILITYCTILTISNNWIIQKIKLFFVQWTGKFYGIFLY